MKTNELEFFEDYIKLKCNEWGTRPFATEIKTSVTFTYNTFFDHVLKAAGFIQKHEIKPKDKVIILMENSIDALTLFIGAIMADIIPILISPNYKLSEIEYVSKTCKASAIFFPSNKRDALQEKINLKHFSYNYIKESREPYLSTESHKTPDDTAYIIFTTGSTGTPKKVEVSHRNILTEIAAMVEAYDITKDDRYLCVLPIYHASGLYRGILLPFDCGGFVALAEEFKKESFWHEIELEQITFVQVVPSILRTLLMNNEYLTEGQQKSLKYIGSASAPHPTELITSFEKKFGVYVLLGYGMTEATCGITLNPINIEHRKLGSVGKPLTVNKVEVVDQNGAILSAGKTGRIIVTGKNITKYNDNGDMQFDSDVFHSKERILDTGDIGRIDADGFVWLESRSQDMIKRGGYRISPNEIENAITKAFPYLEVTVLGVPHHLLGEDIVAFVAKGNYSLTDRDIIRTIKNEIISYKIPSEIIFIDALPMRGVGKIDKNKLMEMYTANNIQNR